LAGLIERVTFHNDENGFCVLRVKACGQRELTTVIGYAAMISAGEFSGERQLDQRSHRRRPVQSLVLEGKGADHDRG
jgi:hypothetical protein